MTESTTNPLDEIDLTILAQLQAEGRISVTELGRRVGLSQPAVSARVQRLERSGVITGYRAVVDPAKLGLNIHAIIRLRTTPARIAEAVALLESLPEVTAFFRLTGEDCLLADVQSPNSARLEQLVDAIARFGPVTTSLVLRDYALKPLAPATSWRST